MSSSISSSDVAPPRPAEWGRWLATFLGALALGAAAVFAFVLIVDPYDSGRAGLLGIKGVRDASPRTANASRARDPQFDSAVIGNSTGQLVKPDELSRLTGSRFVQLTVPGTGPREQLAIMDFFVRQHPRIGALVITADESWCARGAALPMQHPFPFWLYGESNLDFLGKLFSTRALRLSWQRLLVGTGLRQRSAADGYWDYEKEGPGEFAPAIVPRHDGGPAPANVSENFPGVALLGARDQEASGRCAGRAVRAAGVSHDAAARGQSRGRRGSGLQGGTEEAGRRTAALELHRFPRRQCADARCRANFMDFGHYRAIIARKMEAGDRREHQARRQGEDRVLEFRRPAKRPSRLDPACA